MKVANLFNEIGRYFEKRNAFSQTSQAVAASDLPRLNQLISQFDFSSRQKADLLKSSIEKDCVPIFWSLLDRYYNGNVNQCVSTALISKDDGFSGLTSSVTTSPVLNYALAQRAEAVSRSLLMARDIDVTLPTLHCTTYHYTRKRFRPEQAPETTSMETSALQIAARENMHQATALIMQRLDRL